MKTVVVIGAGPGGIMACLEAAKNGNKVKLIEKNDKIGRKLYISGKGRCNITNSADFYEFTSNVVSNPKFTFSALKAFSNFDTVDFFERRGVALKTERGGRVFPESDRASDIIDALYAELKKAGVEILFKTNALSFETDGKRIISLITDRGVYEGDSFVVATGGKSYPLTGSDGSGYALALSLGHTLVEPVPALSAMEFDTVTAGGREYDIAKISLPQGLSLKNVSVTAYYDGKKRSEFGEALFTDSGMSGPVILSLSSYVNRSRNVCVSVDFKPALDEKQLDARLLREFDAAKNKLLRNVLFALLPESLARWYAKLLQICSKPVNEITREDRKLMISSLKSLVFKVRSLAPIENAIVTAGGIKTSEIDAKTMKSKLIENLSFAGEIMDIDALTGGYNIQLALSTGYVAGKYA